MYKTERKIEEEMEVDRNEREIKEILYITGLTNVHLLFYMYNVCTKLVCQGNDQTVVTGL
jgi:hypothetical protein